MPVTTTERLLLAAMRGGYAVGAFNAENMELAQAIVQAAEELRAPVILQTTPGTIRYGSPSLYHDMIAAIATPAGVPVAIHLDHGDSFAMAVMALRAGYSSIMIDGSRLPLAENIALTKSVVDACHPNGIPVEGELGRVGGKEDDSEDGGQGYTDPDEAEEFVAGTGVGSLAVGVGTAHGVYAKKPVLNKGLISVLAKRLGLPLVLHGGSGLEPGEIRDCIVRGIAKVNFATELRAAYTEAVRRHLAENPNVVDPKKFGAPGRDAVRALVMERMRVCGCDGKA
ncbi:MAG: class II fructose-bisphosphate aldolase [Deltaproteobacteria bacterium]|jgi:tagatose 1,6-diphosphate aldolase GatY/KbaY|nr:class II fructose-bisphosphate aldolase [Deltaproteobacteria bacterium]